MTANYVKIPVVWTDRKDQTWYSRIHKIKPDFKKKKCNTKNDSQSKRKILSSLDEFSKHTFVYKVEIGLLNVVVIAMLSTLPLSSVLKDAFLVHFNE